MGSLKHKAILSLFWTFGHQLSTKLINFVVQIILARILLPSDFGLIAMIIVFIAVGNSLSDSGLTSSLIRTSNADDKDYSTVFFINLIGSIFIYFFVYGLAPLIAIFYEEAALTKILRVFALSYIIQALVGVQSTILKKSLEFKKLMAMQLPSVIVGGIVGVFLAWKGYGVWSLVWLNLTQSILFSIQLWITSSWYPSFTIDKERFKIHFNFGYKLAIAGVMNAFFFNIYSLIIGKWYSTAQLGFYNRADTIRMFPLTTIITAFKSVAYPVLSTMKDDDDRLKVNYSRMMLQVVFWITPLMLILILIAEPLFRVLLTDKWLPAVPFFQILCVASILYPLQEYNLQILDVKGRSDIYLKIEFFKKVISVIAIVLVLPFGIYGLLYLQILLALLFFFIGAYHSGKLINFSIKEQLKNIYPIFILSIIIGAGSKYLDIILEAYLVQDISRVIIVSGSYGLFYITLSALLKLNPLIEVLQVVKSLTKSK